MNLLPILCCILLMFSCNTEKTNLQKPTFLIGNWIRINDKDSVTTYEIWQKDFTGIGLTLKGKDTTFFEQMKILIKNDTLFLEVSGVNPTPTLFLFTDQTDTSFVCENPKNEFPKKIKYFLDNQHLFAEVSNADFKTDFVYAQKEY